MTQEVLACAQVPPEMQPVVASLRALVEACGAAMAAQPAKRREAEDNAKRVGGLFWRLNAGQVSAPVQAQLAALARALDAGDLGTASQIQVLCRLFPEP